MSQLELRAVSDGALRLAGGRFVPACTVVTGDDASALATLAAVTSGVAPARGAVLLDGKRLAAWPLARRRVASALAREALPPARNVELAVTRVLAARCDRSVAAEVLERFGLGAWGRKLPDALDRDELRTLALALALSHVNADVVVLYEPLSTGVLEPPRVREHIAAAGARGAVVVLVTGSLATAQSFGGPHASVVNGVLSPAESAA